jgi:cysteinylglycine-S-conjugate dipeptidase
MEHLRDVRLAGSGGSIPIVSARARALPDVEPPLVGTTAGYPNIHGATERVLLDEPEKAVIAETEFCQELPARVAARDTSTWPR